MFQAFLSQRKVLCKACFARKKKSFLALLAEL
jgi:hypothetical protein